VPNQDQETVGEVSQGHGRGEKQRTVVNCNFRSAGRLSNENARALTAIHETFARLLCSAMDGYLGSGIEVKLQGLDQLPMKEHMAGIPALSYIVPLTLTSAQVSVILECDLDLVFPMIEMLLGGTGGQTGGQASSSRELSEIEEEIMHDVALLIARHAESAWHLSSEALTAGRRIKSSVLQQYCPPNEKVTLVKFAVELAGTTGTFQFVLPTAFLNMLIHQIKSDEPQKRSGLRFFPTPSLRERILDCDIHLAAELVGLRVAVRDLISLEPGSVLKLRAPVRTPGTLTAGGQGFFEVMPVRNGSQKAAQLGRRTTPAHWERG